MAKRKRRRASAAPRRRRRRRHNPIANLRPKRHRRRRSHSVTRHRRRHNPPAFLRGGGGWVKRAWDGVKDGIAVEVGRIAVNKIPSLIPVKNSAGLPMFASGLPGVAAGFVTAVAAGFGADKVVRGSGAFVTAGGVSLLIESLLAAAVASGAAPKALSGYVPLAGYVPLSGIPGVDHESPDSEYTPVVY